MKIVFASDHAGYHLKTQLINHFKSLNFDVIDSGTDNNDSMDYPDSIHPASKLVNDNNVDLGIFMCGSGQGASITANKYLNVRAALVWNEDIAKLSKEHNNANVVVLPARLLCFDSAINILNVFFESIFEGGRHQNRIDKIKKVNQ